jgi:hypothetical protein
MESQNIPVGLWVYTNWPLPGANILGLPLLIFLCWPLHYIAFLSLFRALSDRESRELWRGDLIG